MIEYKYISSRKQVAARVDEVFADLARYRNRDWEKLVYVFYETQRFVPEEKWAEQLKDFRGTKSIVIKGVPADYLTKQKKSYEKPKMAYTQRAGLTQH